MRSRARVAVVALIAVIAATYFGAACSGKSGNAASGASPRLKLIFHEEFNRSSLNKRVWHTCLWWATTTCSIESNRELQLWNPRDVLVRDGVLHLRARKRRRVGWNGRRYRYTSGMVMTGGRRKPRTPPGFTYTYGLAEARIKVPKGRGFWPAFWMLPASQESRPEIDAMEILGGSTHVQRMHLHYLNPDGSRADAGARWVGPDFSARWHTFAVDWTPDAIVWYVDGVERWRFADSSVIPREPMYPVLSLAVGGVYPGPPRRSTPFPSYLSVDWIRVWQRG
jgi:beta-glucanase (GH16 family)